MFLLPEQRNSGPQFKASKRLGSGKSHYSSLWTQEWSAVNNFSLLEINSSPQIFFVSWKGSFAWQSGEINYSETVEEKNMW